MKKTLTFAALLFSLTSFGQKRLKPIADYTRTDSVIVFANYTGILIDEEKVFKVKKFLQVDIKGVLELSGNWDTVTITTPKVKFIKVDGKIYEIKRTTELKEVDTGYYPIWLRGGTVTPYIHTDTLNSFYVNPKMKY